MKLINSLFVLSILNIHLLYVFAFESRFVIYNPIEIRNLFKTFVVYTHQKKQQYQYGSQDYSLWTKSNQNIHDSITFSKRRENKSVYLGWIPQYNEDIYNIYGSPLLRENIDIDKTTKSDLRRVAQCFVFLNIESQNTISIPYIIQNPIINSITVDLRILKEDILTLTEPNNINLDLSPLKQFDSGRWYLDFTF
tara:strand:- start:94 stop:675 length:582 start_codon:yes stop_codon:yes gene_type:complete